MTLQANIGRLIREGGVAVDGRPLRLLPDREEVKAVILPLLSRMRSDERGGARRVTGIAGPPGSGKSVLVGWLAAAARALHMHRGVFFSLDGYHLPNAQLDARTGAAPDGRTVSLRLLKGTPPTFDAAALLADLRALRASRAAMTLPAYDRERHEPAAGATRVAPETDWLVVEGNFLFLDGPVWREIREMLDVKISLDAPDRELRRRLASRHARGGRDEAWIAEHFRRTDGPNIATVRSAAHRADIALYWMPGLGLRVCRW